MAFRIASSPYTHNHRATSRIMMLVLLAALPGMAAQWYFFGYGNLIQVALAALTAWGTEAAILHLRKQPVLANLGDHSALLTALLLGVSLPPLAPRWLIVIGTAFAIIIAKQLYGGLGQNPFNPAMIGYVVLLISFPMQMTSWLPPEALQSVTPGLFDSLSMIFTHHTLAGDTIQQLQMALTASAGRRRSIPSKPVCVPDTARSSCWRSRFSAALSPASAGSGSISASCWAACSCC